MDNELELYKEMAAHTQTGWYRAYMSREIFECSDYFKDLFALDSNTISFAEWYKHIREDYRGRVRKEMQNTVNYPSDYYQVIYPVITKDHREVWMVSKQCLHTVDKETNEDIYFGILSITDAPKSEEDIEKAKQANDFLPRLYSISNSLFDFLKAGSSHNAIQMILENVRKAIDGDRVYIFEYYDFQRMQSNTYEVVDDNISSQINFLQKIPTNETPWYSTMILNGKPIIINSLNQIPKEGYGEKELLVQQNIKSVICVPMTNNKGVWGYMGIDMVRHTHEWTNIDYQWLLSICNIISICMELNNAKIDMIDEQTFLENLLKNLPIGYAHISAIRDENGKLVDYILIDNNDMLRDKILKDMIITQPGNFGSNYPDKTLFKERMKIYKQVLDDGKVNEKDIYFPINKIYAHEISYSPGKDQVVDLYIDMTPSKKLEKELTLARNKAMSMDKLKSAFLANMSHEIRTPLNAIVGFSNLLADTEELDERKGFVSIINENSELLLQLISDILDLSKIEAGTFDFVFSDVDVNKLCSDLVCSSQLKVKNDVIILFDPHPDKCILYCDRNRLQQVISNFVNNAIKFTEKGSIRIGYIIKEKSIKFYCSDTGIGVSKKQQSAIFDRFVKLNTFVSGTGLGLAICQTIVKHSKGKIGVDSEPGKGSTFWFTVPTDKHPLVHS